MKKTILIATSFLLLTGCSQQKSQPVDITDQLQKLDNTQLSDETVAKITGNEIEKFSSKEASISFDYPSNWKIITNNENPYLNANSIQITSPTDNNKGLINGQIFVSIPADQGFEEYEKANKDMIKNGEISIVENSPTNKKYIEKDYLWGKGVEYIFKFDKIYVGVHKNSPLDKKEREQLDIILNSLSSI